MVTLENVINRIRSFARSQSWDNAHAAATGFSELAKAQGEEGFSSSAMRDFYRETWAPTAGTIRRLEALVPSDFEPHAEAA